MSNTPIVSRRVAPMLRAARKGVLAAAGLLVMASSSAQYVFDSLAEDDHDEGGIRYFGSAKDQKGKLVAGASIVVVDPQAAFIFVTNDEGRFRGRLPAGTDTSQVQLKCSKAGYQQVRVTKRPGPANAEPTVQVDCLLRAESAS